MEFPVLKLNQLLKDHVKLASKITDQQKKDGISRRQQFSDFKEYEIACLDMSQHNLTQLCIEHVN